MQSAFWKFADPNAWSIHTYIHTYIPYPQHPIGAERAKRTSKANSPITPTSSSKKNAMCRSHTPSRARASQSGALCRLASSLPPFRFPPTAVAQALNVSRVLCPGRIHLPQASLQASPRPDSFRRGTLLCALPHDSHGRAHRSSPQKSTCITHAPVVSGWIVRFPQPSRLSPQIPSTAVHHLPV